MPLPLVVNIPNGNYQVGTSQIAQATVPAGATKMQIAIDTSQWTNPIQILTISLDQSSNNGATWAGGGSWTATGDNLPPTVTSTFQWPPSVTHLRGTVTVSGATIHLSGTITVS